MRTRLATATLILAALGCGGGGSSTPSGGGPAGVDGTKQVSDATQADKTATCDWFANLVGGYGAQPSCDGAVLSAPPSQADCLAQFPSCSVTFADFEACVSAIVAAQAQCTQAALQQAEASTACAAVLPASCF